MAESGGLTQNARQSMRGLSLGFGERLKVAQARSSGTSMKDVDVAALKATSARFHVVPKEKHVRTLQSAASASRSTATYVATVLLQRVHTANDWLTALKTLISLHRLMREAAEPSVFAEELIKVGSAAAKGRGGRVLAVDNFMDTATADGRFDFSEWVRAYGRYLDEQLDVFTAAGWRVDEEEAGKQSKLRTIPPSELLLLLPGLQRLQRRLVDCVPHGQAATDDVVLLSLSLVVRESFRLHKALSEGIINLADAFFSMDYAQANKGLDIYKEALAGAEALAGYYASLQTLQAVQAAIEFPSLQPPPADFVESMESYLKEAPRPAPIVVEDDSSAPSAQPASTRRAVPLRKGRFAHHAGLQRPTSALSDASISVSGALHDPGMLLPPGVVPATTSAAGDGIASGEATARSEANDVAVREQQVDEGTQAERPRVEAAPVVDLLAFDDNLDQGALMPAALADDQMQPPMNSTIQTPSQHELSALDLLAELDFGALSIDTSHTHTQTQPAPAQFGFETTLAQPGASHVAMTGSGISDALVLQAAADMYGRPPPSTQQSHSVHPHPMPHHTIAHPNIHSPPMQHSHTVLGQSTMQQHTSFGAPQAFAIPSPGAAMISPHGLGSLGHTNVTSPGSGSRNEGRIKEAGALDPFASLTGLSPNTTGSR